MEDYSEEINDVEPFVFRRMFDYAHVGDAWNCGVEQICKLGRVELCLTTVHVTQIYITGLPFSLGISEIRLSSWITLDLESERSARVVADLFVYEYDPTTQVRDLICERRYDRIHAPGTSFRIGDSIKLFDVKDYASYEKYYIVNVTDLQVMYIK